VLAVMLLVFFCARVNRVGLPGFEPGRETPVLGFFGPSSGLGERTFRTPVFLWCRFAFSLGILV
jgi:hypothetical protein